MEAKSDEEDNEQYSCKNNRIYFVGGIGKFKCDIGVWNLWCTCFELL